MKINTSQKVLTLKGDAYKNGTTDLTIGGVIAEALAASQEGNKMKLYTLAQRAFSEETMDVDDADISLIRKALEKCTTYNNIIIGQTLLALEK